MNPQTYNELITTRKMYELVTERLESPVLSSPERVAEKPELSHELLDMILDLYNNDSAFSVQDMNRFSLKDILQYIQASHRYYMSKKVPEIEQSLIHIISKFGSENEVLVQLVLFFNEYKNELIHHFKMEDRVVFPYILQLIDAQEGQISETALKQILSASTLDVFDAEHDPIEDELKKVSGLLADYSIKNETPLAFRVFLNQVEIFEMELRKHAIIEDHVLIPMARELENNLKKQINLIENKSNSSSASE